ncbi:MAG: hypothetical protein ONB13_12980 [candidate division KSB1 bacterium]|nr:hypothetical protein [candidate division KSB1 bacterium]MDZ7377519.1 hypothetical protein [candidate division KSB1 bacterium]MDZ7400016.1 hypothetical protein [candidate division KSB1 bacterium]
MKTYDEFVILSSPAQVIASAANLIAQNVPQGSHLNRRKDGADAKGKWVHFKSDYGLFHNCEVMVKAVRCQNQAGTAVTISGCECEKMQKLYRKLRDDL